MYAHSGYFVLSKRRGKQISDSSMLTWLQYHRHSLMKALRREILPLKLAKQKNMQIHLSNIISETILPTSPSPRRKSQYLFSIWSVGITRFHFPVQNIAYASAAYLSIKKAKDWRRCFYFNSTIKKWKRLRWKQRTSVLQLLFFFFTIETHFISTRKWQQ